jgi:hypothetical protein
LKYEGVPDESTRCRSAWSFSSSPCHPDSQAQADTGTGKGPAGGIDDVDIEVGMGLSRNHGPRNEGVGRHPRAVDDVMGRQPMASFGGGPPGAYPTSKW